MKIRLTKVQRSPDLSEETESFSATVLISGLWAGRVTNDGRGGANVYWPSTLAEKLHGFAATLPPRTTASGYVIQPDADWLIYELLEKHHENIRTDGRCP